MRPRSDYERVERLIHEGLNDCQISRATGINRTTVREWRHLGAPGTRDGWSRGGDCPLCDGVALDAAAYSYLLGLYLGDGCISPHPRAYRLRIALDARYPSIIDECQRSMAAVRPTTPMRVGTVKCVGCVEVGAYWQHWPCLFPQHGPGRKHLRNISLVDWQQQIVREHPRELLRGLIHSDGCRAANRVGGGQYSYPRYFFTNNSAGILQIFRDACDALNIAHRNSKPNTISVAHREAVAALDAFIGPKA